MIKQFKSESEDNTENRVNTVSVHEHDMSGTLNESGHFSGLSPPFLMR